MNNYYNNDQNNFDPYIGFIRGNVFDNLYSQYKNYQPDEMNPTNEKDYMMTMLQIYSFNLNDLDLYLDLNPNKTDIINLRSNYLKKYNELKKDYETKYGAIDLSSDTLSKTPWGWNSSFPWEVSK